MGGHPVSFYHRQPHPPPIHSNGAGPGSLHSKSWHNQVRESTLTWSLPSPHIGCLLSSSSLDSAACISHNSSLWKSGVCSPSTALHALFQVSLWVTVTQSDHSISQPLGADHSQRRQAFPSSGTRAEQRLLPPDSIFSSKSVFWLESVRLQKIDLLGGQHAALISCYTDYVEIQIQAET